MQSAAKCPVLVAFDVARPGAAGAPRPGRAALILKVGDDCRQDVLALQVLALLKARFDAAALPLPLRPYGVVPTGHERGLIEVVPRAKSRAQLGELADGGLAEVFQAEFGLPGSARHEAARAAFVESCAAYAVATYVLQAKDRHNGNIMLDAAGRLVHIDFGYILGISPGGNLGFEAAAFKLSFEMAQVLDPGGGRASPSFRRFRELCARGFLAARGAAEEVVAVAALMADSGLPCFERGRPVEALRARLRPGDTDAEAAAWMLALVDGAYDAYTTGVYDWIQWQQNRIAF
jgi:phosphatidylinositol 4-kinase